MNLKLAFVFWFAMVVIAIVNGVFAETVLIKALGDYGSHIYRTLFIITVIFIGSRLYLRKAAGGGEIFTLALSAGFLWLFSSLIFEFIFGHYVFRLPWERIISEYRIREGRLWALVIASEVISPLVNACLIG